MPWPIVTREAALSAVLTALAERPPRMIVLDGPAGVGKTALAAEAARRLPGRTAVTVSALAERTSTPLGVLLDALDVVGATAELDPASGVGVEAVAAALDRRLLVVDDAPRLDDASAEIVRRLVVGFGVPVVGTARSGETLPAPLRRLDGDRLVRRLAVEGLGADEVARLLAERFRVPVRESDLHRLVWETAGNPLHLRLLVEAAIEEGRVLHRGDDVEVVDTPSPTDLASMLAARLADLSDNARRLLGVVALTQPVPRARVLVPPGREAALAELVRRGLVVTDAGSTRVRVAHPLIAEAASTTDAVDEAVRVLRAADDPTRRFAAVELERRAGRRLTAEELTWASTHAAALGDPHRAVELADLAVAQPARRSVAFDAHLAAAHAHSLAHDLDGADRLFALADDLAADPAEAAALASAHGEHLAYRRGEPTQAVAHAERVRSRLTSAEAVALDADLWRWRVLAERTTGALDDEPEQRVRGAIAASVAASMRGEHRAALSAAGPLLVPRAALGDLASTAGIALGLQRVLELRATRPAEEAAAYLESARAEAPEEVGFHTVMLAAQRLQEGRLADALELGDLAIEQLQRWDGGELIALARAVRATAAAQRGDLDDARSRLEALDGGEVSGAAVLQAAECRAYLLAAEGDSRGAAATVLTVVEDAIASGYRYLGGLTLATAIRFGETDRTAELADELCTGMAERVDPCVAVRDLATALRDRRPADVVPAARRAARAGLVTVAIDGMLIALGMPASDDVHTRLQSAITRLAAGVDAPALQRRDLPSLTAREREVARGAANRLRSREIADRLNVSVRTVENQLYSVYRKLGVASRDELRDAMERLGLLTDATTPR